MCRSSKEVGQVYSNKQCDCSEAFLGTVGTETSNPWIVSLQVMTETVDFHIDTGAEVSVILDQVNRKVGSLPLTPPNQTLRGPSKKVLPVKGRFAAKLVRGDRETEQQLYIAEDLHRPLLG